VEQPRHDGVPDGLMVVGEELPPPSEVNDLLVGVCAGLALLGAATFGIGLALRLPIHVYGGGLALALLALAIGVRRYFAAAYADIEAVEPRGLPDPSEAPMTEVERARPPALPRRLLLAAAGVLGLSFLVPVSSLGPAPGNALRRTAWTRGVRLVTTDGRPLRPGDVVAGGIATVWPEGAVHAEDASVVLVRLSGQPPLPPTNLEWVVNGQFVAYSKVCTHAGCPVGLFRERDNALFCPCHQSTFDAARAAQPTFGPAARALPQLPMGLDDDGYLIALGDFIEQVGPAFG
jgi:ubiquinol-cytochrome c reductase iron-sulfur subunit